MKSIDLLDSVFEQRIRTVSVISLMHFNTLLPFLWRKKSITIWRKLCHCCNCIIFKTCNENHRLNKWNLSLYAPDKHSDMSDTLTHTHTRSATQMDRNWNVVYRNYAKTFRNQKQPDYKINFEFPRVQACTNVHQPRIHINSLMSGTNSVRGPWLHVQFKMDTASTSLV